MAVARRLDRYELIEEIGAGGMATVYRGRDSALDREVAIKVLHPHLAAQEDARTRFQREAKAVAKLRHQNILDIYDYSGVQSDESYIVAELIHGPTLKRFVEDGGRVPAEVAAMIVYEVSGAVAAAHAHGVIHRDIKPENVMIREDGVVKLADFGIAQMVDAGSMTITGQILGSPAHMAPEQIESSEVDGRADIFALGTVLYYVATAHLPFEGRNPHQVLRKVMECDYPDPLRVEPVIGDRLAGIIRKCLSRRPDDRYQTADELRAALAAFLTDLECGEPATELPKYFHDPAGYVAALQPRIVEVLVRRGRESRKRGAAPHALDYFNRALALDENNREVLRLVGGIERRRRVIRYVAAAAALALLGGGAGFAFRQMGGEARGGYGTARPTVETPFRVHRAETGGIRGAPAESPADAAAAQIARVPAGAGVERGGTAARGVRTLSFNPAPCVNVRVVLDGVDLGQYGDVLTRQVDVGTHTVQYVPNEDVPCAGGPFPINVGTGEAPFPVSWPTFSWVPALLRIDSNVPATVVAGGLRLGETGSLIRVRMRTETDSVRVLVEADGYEPHIEILPLRAGVATQKAVTLLPRRTSTPGSP